jgi:prevent-host-death family protein
MRPLRVSANITSVSDFQAHTPRWLRRVAASRQPLVIVRQGGKPAGVVLSPELFDELTERARFVTAVEKGLADVEAGRLHSHESVHSEMKKRFSVHREP